MTTTTIRPDTDLAADPEPPWLSGNTRARRLRMRLGRGRSVPHLALGAVLVAGCAAGFLTVFASSDTRTEVLALSRPVTVGHVLDLRDLAVVEVAVDDRVPVIPASRSASLIGESMATSLPAGALLTQGAVGPAMVPAAGHAIAALSLKAGQYPPEVAPGAQVSVVATPTAQGAPSPAWAGVVTGVGTSAGESTTVVSVQLPRTQALEVAAIPVGRLALVLLAEGER
ncbi:SAF domain-containing protein [Actinokineospora sp. HUAS TT18]|uniref:SAF domain-containing protein n=1 Tax=Actinokineospora sp. HUAS TT18 TaxID=3447451 RepID=UPI003F527BE0